MALPIVHLLAARKWATDKPGLFESPEFYLGAVAPDAIHVRYGNDKSRKNEFHLMNWTSPHPEAVRAYWAERFAPFDIGYGIHVLTDSTWVPRYRQLLPGLVNPEGKLRTDVYYNDTMRTDYALLERHAELRGVFDLLAWASAPTDHPFLTEAEFLAWRDMMLDAYRKPCPFQAPVLFVNEAYAEEFIEAAQPFLNEITGRYFHEK